jgi:predicted nucleic acid-binding protein
MGVILDTSIWVDVERGRLAPADVQSVTKDEPVFLTPATIAELKYGVARAATPAERNRRAAALARIMRKPCLIIDRTTGDLFAQIAADLGRQGRAAKHRVQDIWIAALAIQHSLSLLTHNRRDFEDIPGLSLLSLPRT